MRWLEEARRERETGSLVVASVACTRAASTALYVAILTKPSLHAREIDPHPRALLSSSYKSGWMGQAPRELM